MEEEISGLEVKIEPMDSSVKGNVKSEKKNGIKHSEYLEHEEKTKPINNLDRYRGRN